MTAETGKFSRIVGTDGSEYNVGSGAYARAQPVLALQHAYFQQNGMLTLAPLVAYAAGTPGQPNTGSVFTAVSPFVLNPAMPQPSPVGQTSAVPYFTPNAGFGS